MSRKWNLGLSLAAGLLGGLLSHYISPGLVHAQAQVPPPKEIRAQSFVLVDSKGVSAGVFGFDKDGSASIKLMDQMGKVIWSANGKASVAPLSSSIRGSDVPPRIACETGWANLFPLRARCFQT